MWPVTFSEIDGEATILDGRGVHGTAIELLSTEVMFSIKNRLILVFIIQYLYMPFAK